MKKGWILLLVLCLFAYTAAYAEATPPKLSYEPLEVDMPAAAMMIYAPGDMDSMGGDEVAYDTGFRFNCNSPTFDMDVSVYDTRDMNIQDYAAFYANRYGYGTVTAETINDLPVQYLTKADKPGDFAYLLVCPDQDTIDAAYAITFTCDGETDIALAKEIMSTLAPYGY